MKDLSVITNLNGEEQKAISTSRLYEFLELHSAHYSRWVKTNIIGNDFAEEGIDYVPFTINGELKKDYALDVKFSKKLSVSECPK